MQAAVKTESHLLDIETLFIYDISITKIQMRLSEILKCSFKIDIYLITEPPILNTEETDKIRVKDQENITEVYPFTILN